MTMTKHQQERKDRAEAKARRLRAEGEAQWEKASKIGEHIPMGQPILVGHHSEKRHRRDIARIQKASSKGVELLRQADSAASAAARAGQSVSSDDPEALDALAKKLAGLEEKRAIFKKANKLLRQKGITSERLAAAMGWKEETALKVMEPDFAGRRGFPAYELTNLGANIRRVRKRIEQLEKAAAEPEREPIEGEGWRIEEDKDENRIRVILDKQHPDGRAVFKRLGFRYSRRNEAWQRHLNNAGRHAAGQAVGKLFRLGENTESGETT